jgi:hypothetical protein
MDKKIQKLTVSGFLIFFILPFVFLYSRSRYLSKIGFDEEYFLYYGWAILKGQVPYKDFFEPKPPIIFFANALGLKLFGLDNNLYRIVPGLLAFISIIFFYFALILQKIRPFLACLFTLQVAFWLLDPQFHDTGLNDCETYGFSFCLLGLGLVLASGPLNKTKRSWILFFAGLCFGLSVLSKELFLFSVVPAWLLSGYDFEKSKWESRRIISTSLGGAAIAILFLGYLMFTKALSSYWEMIWFYRKFATGYCVNTGRFPKLPALQTSIESIKILHRSFFKFSTLQFILPLFIFGVLTYRRRLLLLFFIIPPVFGAYAISIGQCFWNHYYLMGIIGVVIPTFLGAKACEKDRRFLRKSKFVLPSLFILFILSAWPISRLVLLEQKNKNEEFYLSFKKIDPFLRKTIAQYSSPSDFIFSNGSPLIYVLSDRLSPLNTLTFDGGIDFLLPGNTDTDRFIPWNNILEQKPPKIFHLDLTQKNHSRVIKSLFLPFIQRHHYLQIQDDIWVLSGYKELDAKQFD